MSGKARRSRKANKKAVAAGQSKALLADARRAAANAYAPYSGFAVGAAVQTSDGRVFSAANMENASYGLTVCAEVGALQAVSSAGQLNKVTRIAIVGGPLTAPPGYRAQATPPCGRCRQLISEAAMLGGHDIEIWYADIHGKVVQQARISQLLPGAFGPKNLK